MEDGCMSVKDEDYKRLIHSEGSCMVRYWMADEGMRYDGLRILREGGGD